MESKSSHDDTELGHDISKHLEFIPSCSLQIKLKNRTHIQKNRNLVAASLGIVSSQPNDLQSRVNYKDLLVPYKSEITQGINTSRRTTYNRPIWNGPKTVEGEDKDINVLQQDQIMNERGAKTTTMSPLGNFVNYEVIKAISPLQESPSKFGNCFMPTSIVQNKKFRRIYRQKAYVLSLKQQLRDQQLALYKDILQSGMPSYVVVTSDQFDCTLNKLTAKTLGSDSKDYVQVEPKRQVLIANCKILKDPQSNFCTATGTERISPLRSDRKRLSSPDCQIIQSPQKDSQQNLIMERPSLKNGDPLHLSLQEMMSTELQNNHSRGAQVLMDENLLTETQISMASKNNAKIQITDSPYHLEAPRLGSKVQGQRPTIIQVKDFESGTVTSKSLIRNQGLSSRQKQSLIQPTTIDSKFPASIDQSTLFSQDFEIQMSENKELMRTNQKRFLLSKESLNQMVPRSKQATNCAGRIGLNTQRGYRQKEWTSIEYITNTNYQRIPEYAGGQNYKFYKHKDGIRVNPERTNQMWIFNLDNMQVNKSIKDQKPGSLIGLTTINSDSKNKQNQQLSQHFSQSERSDGKQQTTEIIQPISLKHIQLGA